MLKILLISYAFPPISSPGAQRVESFANYLSKMGVDVTVLTCSNAYSSMNDKNFSPTAQLQYKVIKTNDLLDKTSIGNSIGANQNRMSLKSKVKRSFKSIIKKTGNFLIFPDRDITWLPTALKKIKNLDGNYDFVLGSYPYATNFILAYKASKILNCKLILDYRDLWTQDDNHFKKSIIKRFLNNKLESIITSRASGIVSVSKFNSELLKNKLVNRSLITTIYNGYEGNLLNQLNKYEPSFSEKFTITYAGSFYGGERNPAPLLEAISQLKKNKIISPFNFQFNFIGNTEKFFENLVTKYALNDLVIFKGFCSSVDVFKILKSSNVQLVITRNQSISKGEMTTKVFEYLGVGRAICCLTKADFEIASVLNTFECASCIDVDESNDIYNYLATELNEFTATNYKLKSFDNGSKYTREDAAKELLCFLQDI